MTLDVSARSANLIQSILNLTCVSRDLQAFRRIDDRVLLHSRSRLNVIFLALYMNWKSKSALSTSGMIFVHQKILTSS